MLLVPNTVTPYVSGADMVTFGSITSPTFPLAELPPAIITDRSGSSKPFVVTVPVQVSVNIPPLMRITGSWLEEPAVSVPVML